MGYLLYMPQLEIEPGNQAYALTGNRTSNFSGHRTTLSQQSFQLGKNFNIFKEKKNKTNSRLLIDSVESVNLQFKTYLFFQKLIMYQASTFIVKICY